jgi:site-specific DNA-methyltransferase (cytosine-N4-specific)
MVTIHNGNCLDILREIEASSVQCVVTSPPYWGLRDYGVDGQIGLEATPEEYVAKIVEVFGAVKKVLRDDGTLWINLGDSYTSGGRDKWNAGDNHLVQHAVQEGMVRNPTPAGLKPKDLVGVPWRVAFALQAAGWYLRQDIIWSKPNPMPESVRDRCTKSHEYLFLLSKSERYYYDFDAIKEPVTGGAHARGNGVNPKAKVPAGWDTGPGNHQGLVGRYKVKQNESFSAAVCNLVESRNCRSVWTIPTYAYPEAHFATFPPDLVKPCVLAGSKVGDTILDPFAGSGTTLMVAQNFGRKSIGIELNEKYCRMILKRTAQTAMELGVSDARAEDCGGTGAQQATGQVSPL